jgi:hypothetical protein
VEVIEKEIELLCISRLRSIVSLWPKKEVRLASPSHALKDLLASDFDAIDLATTISGVAEISDVQIDTGSATIEFLDFDDTPHRAMFKQTQSGEWKLKALKFQCPVCFGTGINDGEKCVGCSGVGWGAA